MEKYLFSDKEEFIASDQIAGRTYVLNLIAQIIAIVVFLFFIPNPLTVNQAIKTAQ